MKVLIQLQEPDGEKTFRIEVPETQTIGELLKRLDQFLKIRGRKDSIRYYRLFYKGRFLCDDASVVAGDYFKERFPVV